MKSPGLGHAGQPGVILSATSMMLGPTLWRVNALTGARMEAYPCYQAAGHEPTQQPGVHQAPKPPPGAAMQEAEMLCSLCHPCVIAMYGLVVGQESPGTVLEYVRGSSLKSALGKLGQQGKVTPRLKAAVALQAARGAPSLVFCARLQGSGVGPAMFGSVQTCLHALTYLCRTAVWGANHDPAGEVGQSDATPESAVALQAARSAPRSHPWLLVAAHFRMHLCCSCT